MRNPWMSMYLSTANRVAGSVRAKALAEVPALVRPRGC